MTNYLFAYGTLRQEAAATHTLEGYEMYDYGAFPYIIRTNRTDDKVKGNLYLVEDDDEWKQLDKYEGVARGLYTRELVSVWDDMLRARVKAHVYVATNELHPRLIKSGDWLRR